MPLPDGRKGSEYGNEAAAEAEAPSKVPQDNR
jgi:hypothetical protein